MVLAAVLSAFVCSGCVYSTGTTSSRQNAYSTVSEEAPSSAPVSSEEDTLPGIGMTVESDEWKISLLDAKQYDEIVVTEFYTNTPEDGKKFLVLFFEAENTSGKDDYFNYYNIESYEDGYHTNISVIMGDVDGQPMIVGDVAAGKKIKGYLAWEVSADWQELEVSYKNNAFGTSKAATFLVTPDQVTVVE